MPPFAPIDAPWVDLGWPAALLLAWLAGEGAQRWLSLPRVSAYGLAGFLLGASQLGLLPAPGGGPAALLADFAFGLVLFELGHRINLRWLRVNPWIGAGGVAEAVAAFAAVFAVARAFGLEALPSLLLAALGASTSPAAMLRVSNELRSSGQVTERALHHAAIGGVLAVVAFKAVIGYALLLGAGGPLRALWSSVAVLALSAGLGGAAGMGVPLLLARLVGAPQSTTIAYALSVFALTAATHALRLSPLVAALAFGLVARHRRTVLAPPRRDFGALGDLLTIHLFVFVGATLEWRHVLAGAGLGVAIAAARAVAKTAAVAAFARVSGTTLRKGLLTGVALTPLSVFAILLLEQSRHLGLAVVDEVAAVGAVVLLLEVAGPVATRWALVRAGETSTGEG